MNRKRDELPAGVGPRNKLMNEGTYVQRRRVLEFVYECKEVVELDWTQIRITEKSSCDAGRATLGKPELWIMEQTLNDYDKVLRLVVYHEIGHTLGLVHDEDSVLMESGWALNKGAGLTKRQAQKEIRAAMWKQLGL